MFVSVCLYLFPNNLMTFIFLQSEVSFMDLQMNSESLKKWSPYRWSFIQDASVGPYGPHIQWSNTQKLFSKTYKRYQQVVVWKVPKKKKKNI